MSKLLQELKINPSYLDVLVIGGPTASGKTALSVRIAKELIHEGQPAWVISADSRQIYTEMDICSAKPTKRALESDILSENVHLDPIPYKEVPHFLFDIKNPDQKYTLFDFKEQAEEIIELAHSQEIKVVIAGGTGLYIDALINNYSIKGPTTSSTIRKALEDEYQKMSQKEGEDYAKQTMWGRLNNTTPNQAIKHPPGDIYGVLRSLEVALTTNSSKSDLATKNKPTFDYQMIILDPPREQLYDYINNRCQEMLDEGLIEETMSLIKKYSLDLPAMTSIGYKQFSQYLNDKISKEEALMSFQKATRNYAKRQLTWFRRYKGNSNVKFIDSYKLLLKKAPTS